MTHQFAYDSFLVSLLKPIIIKYYVQLVIIAIIFVGMMKQLKDFLSFHYLNLLYLLDELGFMVSL
jgi:hypothetical protein